MLDLADAGVRRWFTAHAFTTDAIVGVLVLLVTVLNVNRIVRRHQLRDRAQALAAQTGLVARQAQRTAQTVDDALHGRAERDAASDEIRTFMTMLMVSAPMLIEARRPRQFLEEADRLAALLGTALSAPDGPDADLDRRIEETSRRVDDAARPLVDTLSRAEQSAVSGAGDES